MGTASPVRAASNADKLLTSNMRRSAGTRSPRLSLTTSPGTISSAGTLTSFPSRTTNASDDNMAFKASAAFSAEPSWTIPIVVFTVMTKQMRPTSIKLVTRSSEFFAVAALTAATMATTAKIPTNTFATCAQIRCNNVVFSFSVSLLGPNLAKRDWASGVDNPLRGKSGDNPNSAIHSSLERACQGKSLVRSMISSSCLVLPMVAE
mmetsp:Transcript_19659/g.40918  ORF Transcript_19659/g.40918 Transcript_19659/m.40918 type:complete len:206 (+) Transcript_19659:248-865(+)